MTLYRLHFENNTSLRNGEAACLRFSASQPISITVRSSFFYANSGFQNTIASITGILAFSLVDVVAANNTARGSSAGLALYPYTENNSFFRVLNCTFRDNSAYSDGVLLVSDSSGMALSRAFQLKFEVTNCTFERNSAQMGGSSISIAGSVFLSTESAISGVFFLHNTCEEGGAAINSHYLAGDIHIQSCLFQGNTGNSGAAIWSTHQGHSTYLVLNSCLFVENQGNSIVAMTAIGSNLISSENTFRGSVGTAVLVYQSDWQDSGSVYEWNSGKNAGAALFSTSATGAFTNVTFRGNSAEKEGGGLTVWTESTVACLDCVFRNNSAGLRGGALYLEGESSFSGKDVSFVENGSGDRGSVLFALLSNFTCVQCLFVRNTAAEYAAVFMMGAEAHIEHCQFTGNQASLSSPGIMLSLAALTVRNCSFAQQAGDLGSFISLNEQSTVRVSQSTFQEGHARTHGGCFYSMVNSSILLEDSVISHCSAGQSGSVLRSRTGSVVFRRVTIRNVTSDLSSGAIMLSDGSAVLEIDCAMMLGSAISARSSSVLVQKSRFIGLKAYNGAAASISDCPMLTIDSSYFEGGLAKRGGAVYVFSTGSSAANQVTIYRNSTFLGNKAVNGGAIYSESVDVHIFGCSFLGNSVSQDYYASAEILHRGIGAGIYAANAYIVFANYQIVENLFENNTATTMGAALYWFDTYPTFANNTLKGNSAPYGSEIASFPIRLCLLHPNNSLITYLSQDTQPLVLSLLQVGSGQVYDGVLRLGLVDQYDNIVTKDSSSSANIRASEKGGNSSLSGSIQVDAIEGIFEFKDVTFLGNPKSTQFFLITTNGIDPFLKTFTTDPHDYHPTVKVTVEFRDCQAGESYQGLACYRCPAGTFSLSPSQACNPCPSLATCLGGFVMVPQAGYWRPDPLRNLFLACPNPDSCLGSPSAENPSLIGICAAGYTGNLCSVCVEGFSRQSRDACNKCPGLTSNIVVSALVVLGALCLLALAISIAVRGANKPRSQLAIYLKIFVNYLQMIVVAASLSLSWPSLIKLFLSGQEVAGNMAEQLFSFDCITQEFSSDQTTNVKLITVSLLPAVLVILSAVAWLAIALCFKQTALRQKVISSLVMILFIIHPSLTKVMLAEFSCREILPGELWLTSDLSKRCWESGHFKEILTVVLPGLLVWGFGLPSLALGVLIKARAHLTDNMISLQFSFLYKGYTEKWFFWEFVILYRKVALICSAVFFNSVSTMIQALSVLAVLLICLFLQLAVKPFAMPNFNTLELKSLFVSLITIYAGLYFEANSMNQVLSILIFLLILLANAYFLLGWGKAVLPILLTTISQRLNCGKRHYAIRPMPAKYDESLGESSSFSKATGTQHPVQSNVLPIQFSAEVEVAPSVSPPDNSVNLDVEHSVGEDLSEYIAASFREV